MQKLLGTGFAVLLTAMMGAGCASLPRTAAPATSPATTAGSGKGPGCPSAPDSGGVYVVGGAISCSLRIPPGAHLRVDLPKTVTFGGTTRSYSVPRSGDPAVLAPLPSSNACPKDDRCSEFVARGAGRAVVSWSAPSGCGGGGPCVLGRLFEVAVVVPAA